MPEIVPATAQMIAETEGALPRTSRVWALVEGERVLGLFGFYPESGRLVLFARFSDQLRSDGMKFKRTIARGYGKLLALLSTYDMPVHSLADPKVDGSCRLLEHMGFKPIGEGVYEWRGQLGRSR